MGPGAWFSCTAWWAGLTDEKFGIDLLSAIYECASPAIPPVTVRTALGREADYLREREGQLYADSAPTLNNIVRRIEQVVRGLLRTDIFDVRATITDSEDIPDNVNKPQLDVLPFRGRAFDPVSFVERRGDAPAFARI